MDFVFDAFSAWNSFGLFLMATLLLLTGGGMLGYELMWRVRGRRIKARIKDVRVLYKKKAGAVKFAGEAYYVVYEYQLPNGERTEYMSGWRSNMLGKNIPGREIDVLVSARNPGKMKRPYMAVLIFGLAFFLPGLFIMSQAVQSFEFNYMAVLLPLVFFGYMAFRISRFITKIPKDMLNEFIGGVKKNGFSDLSSSSSFSFSSAADNAVALTGSELRERMRAYAKNYKFGMVFCFLLAFGSGGGAYYAGHDMLQKLAIGLSVQGEVVDFERHYSSSSDGGGYTYYSVVKYVADDGQSVRFRDQIGSSHRMHTLGDLVDVLYHPDDPYDAMIDRGIWNWAISGGLALLSVLMFLAGVDNMRHVRLYGGGLRDHI